MINDNIHCSSPVHIINDNISAGVSAATEDNIPVRKLFPENCSQCGSLPCYADDSTYLVSSSSRQRNQKKIEDMSEKLKKFLNANMLTIHLSKTELVEIMVRQKRHWTDGEPPHLEVTTPQGELKTIRSADHCRLLGANIYKNMSWSAQLETGKKASLKNIRSIIGSLKHISKNIPFHSKLLLAYGLVMGRVAYLMPL